MTLSGREMGSRLWQSGSEAAGKRGIMEKFWKDGEFTPFANRIMYAACWIVGITGFIAGSM